MDLVVYRTSDRPSYMKRSLPHLVDHTSSNSWIVVVNNPSTLDHSNQIDLPEQDDFGRPLLLVEKNGRIGGPNAINEGIRAALSEGWKVQNIFIVDDDTYVPLPQHYDGEMVFWDQCLSRMLDAGWKVVGHPWSPQFTVDPPEPRPPVEIGGVKGVKMTHVAGTCSGFSKKTWEKYPIRQQTLIHGYTGWQGKVGGEAIGYCAEPYMFSVHFDRPEHPHSERDTTYDKWSNEMYWERWPKRRSPKHSHHKRPHGQQGAW